MVKTVLQLSGQCVTSHIDVDMLGETTSAKEPPDAYVVTDSIALVKNDQASDLTHGHGSHEAIMQV